MYMHVAFENLVKRHSLGGHFDRSIEGSEVQCIGKEQYDDCIRLGATELQQTKEFISLGRFGFR